MISKRLYDEVKQENSSHGRSLVLFLQTNFSCLYLRWGYVYCLNSWEKIRDFGKFSSNQRYSGYLGTAHFEHHLR